MDTRLEGCCLKKIVSFFELFDSYHRLIGIEIELSRTSVGPDLLTLWEAKPKTEASSVQDMPMFIWIVVSATPYCVLFRPNKV